MSIVNLEVVKNKSTLPFDFYLLQHGTLIEYDGVQHYKSIIQFGGETQHNDKIKTEYCKQNNIQLIRIPYHKFKNIESILNESIS